MRFVNREDNTPRQPAAMPYTCGSFSGTPPLGTGSYLMQQPMSTMPGTPVMPITPITPSALGMPTGFPTGGTATPLLPSQGGIPAVPLSEQPPTTVSSVLYTPGFLRTQIGRRMRIEFLIGTGALIDRTGTLLTVGASYILIRLVDSDDVMLCDIYSIKFITIFH